MKNIKVCINAIEDVKEFNSICSKSMCDIDVGSGKYIVDGKSILGLYSLDLTKPVCVSINGTSNDIESFISMIGRFIVI